MNCRLSVSMAFVACLLFVVPVPVSAADSPSTKSFVYKKARQADLEIVVHVPPGWKETDKRPAIVFFFGGGWENGTIKQFEPQAGHLASRGMVAARADYRVKSRQGVTPKECVEDAKSAVRWMRQNAAKLGIDPNRIVAAGGSAGGHIAACTALTPGLDAEGEDTKISSKPNALVLFNPVLRFDGIPELMAADWQRRGPGQGDLAHFAPEEGQPADIDSLRNRRPAAGPGRGVHEAVEGVGASGRDVHG